MNENELYEEDLTLCKRPELDARVVKLAKDPALDAVADSEYLVLFWELLGFLSPRPLDSWTANYLNYLLDRMEIASKL